MQRLAHDPRPGWQKKLETLGFTYHTLGGVPYWDESASYQLTNYEVDQLEAATNTLHQMCLDLVDEVVRSRQLNLFLIPDPFHGLVLRSWNERQPSLYGRFDLAFDGTGPPRMLEYNADTPTALVEASVAQWFWLKDLDERGDQFNSIHERLIDAWKALRKLDPRPIHFAAMADQLEDYVTVEYLRDTAMQAGFDTYYLDVEAIGWDSQRKLFVDLPGHTIQQLFKLYPWEWLIRERFGANLLQSSTRWIEPAWKMLLSCKSILPLLWERHPNSPLLAPASFEPLPGNFVRKPILAREGCNITVVVHGQTVLETGGPYADGPFVYQQLVPIRPFDGRYPIFGSWVVNGVSCGVGIRESDAIVTQNTSRFVPHQMVV